MTGLFSSAMGIGATAQARVMATLDVLTAPARFAIQAAVTYIMLFLVVPFMIICWCFYHPAMFVIYFQNLPLLMTDWVTRSVVILIILLILTQIKATRAIAVPLLKLVVFSGFVFYVTMIFKMA